MLALWRILLRAIIRERDTYIAEKIRQACDGHQILDNILKTNFFDSKKMADCEFKVASYMKFSSDNHFHGVNVYCSGASSI